MSDRCVVALRRKATYETIVKDDPVLLQGANALCIAVASSFLDIAAGARGHSGFPKHASRTKKGQKRTSGAN